jgi:hypothetical protein
VETNARAGGDGRGKERRIGLRTARARVTADRARIGENCSPTPLGQSARRRVEALSIERVYAERLVAIAAEIGGLVD